MWPCRSSHRSVCVYCNGRIVHVASTRSRSRSSMTKRCHRRRGCARPTNHLLHQTSLYQQPLHDSRWCLGGLGPYLHEVVSDRRRSHTRDCMCQRGYQVMQHRIPLLLGITVDALSRWRVRVSRHALTCFVPWLAMHPGQGTLPGKPHARHSAVHARATHCLRTASWARNSGCSATATDPGSAGVSDTSPVTAVCAPSVGTPLFAFSRIFILMSCNTAKAGQIQQSDTQT